MRKGRLVLALLITGLVLTGIGVTSVQALCYRPSMQVERVLQYYDSAGGNTYIYLEPARSVTNTTYYYCRSAGNQTMSGARMAAIAATAQANRSEVYVYGTAGSCPSSGYIGDCYYIYMLQ
jgi:hypothetical protein